MSGGASRMEQQHAIEQFYYREARMLDDRRFLAWLDLLTEDVRYVIPTRHISLGDPAGRGADGFHPVERELGGPEEAAFREDRLPMLTVRARRALAPNAWAENPPARTRRFITNVEIEGGDAGDGADEVRVWSNFMLSYSRHGADNHLYSGQRQDRLRRSEDGFRIAERRIVLDWNVVTAPTLALMF